MTRKMTPWPKGQWPRDAGRSQRNGFIKTIPTQVIEAALREYAATDEPIRIIAARHGMCSDTLSKKVRESGGGLRKQRPYCCRTCNTPLTTTNWPASMQQSGAQKCRDCRNAEERLKDRHLKLDALNAYGKQCACCGEVQPAFLSIDHPNGDGAEHRRTIVGGGKDLYAWLKRHGYPPGYRTLCFNCNCSLGALGYCPHMPYAPPFLSGVNERRRRLKAKVIAAYGDACACCGVRDTELLTLDHPANDGRQHRKGKVGYAFYLALVRAGFPPGLRVLCYNCNCSLGFYNYCPHKSDQAFTESVRRDATVRGLTTSCNKEA